MQEVIRLVKQDAHGVSLRDIAEIVGGRCADGIRELRPKR